MIRQRARDHAKARDNKCLGFGGACTNTGQTQRCAAGCSDGGPRSRGADVARGGASSGAAAQPRPNARPSTTSGRAATTSRPPKERDQASAPRREPSQVGGPGWDRTQRALQGASPPTIMPRKAQGGRGRAGQERSALPSGARASQAPRSLRIIVH